MRLKSVSLADGSTALAVRAGLLLQRHHAAAPETPRAGQAPPAPAGRPAQDIEIVAMEDGGTMLLIRPPAAVGRGADGQGPQPVSLADAWLSDGEVTLAGADGGVRLLLPQDADAADTPMVALPPPGVGDLDLVVSEEDGVVGLPRHDSVLGPEPPALQFVPPPGVAAQSFVATMDEEGLVVVHRAPAQGQAPVALQLPLESDGGEPVLDEDNGVLELH